MASQSRTETLTAAVVHIQPPASQPAVREEPPPAQPQSKQVSWVEGTVDNESLGRRSSKVCCVYHKPRAFAESSSSSDSSSDSEPEKGASSARGSDPSSEGEAKTSRKKCNHQRRRHCGGEGRLQRGGDEEHSTQHS